MKKLFLSTLATVSLVSSAFAMATIPTGGTHTMCNSNGELVKMTTTYKYSTAGGYWYYETTVTVIGSCSGKDEF